MLQELRRRHILLNVDELVAAGMQADAWNWQMFLDISGGKLAITKCLYYLCYWIWKADGTPPNLLDAATIGNLTLMNDNPTTEQPPQLDPWQSQHLTLGVWKSVAGNYHQQWEHLLNKSRKWTESMRPAT